MSSFYQDTSHVSNPQGIFVIFGTGIACDMPDIGLLSLSGGRRAKAGVRRKLVSYVIEVNTCSFVTKIGLDFLTGYNREIRLKIPSRQYFPEYFFPHMVLPHSIVMLFLSRVRFSHECNLVLLVYKFQCVYKKIPKKEKSQYRKKQNSRQLPIV